MADGHSTEVTVSGYAAVSKVDDLYAATSFTYDAMQPKLAVLMQTRSGCCI